MTCCEPRTESLTRWNTKRSSFLWNQLETTPYSAFILTIQNCQDDYLFNMKYWMVHNQSQYRMNELIQTNDIQLRVTKHFFFSECRKCSVFLFMRILIQTAVFIKRFRGHVKSNNLYSIYNIILRCVRSKIEIFHYVNHRSFIAVHVLKRLCQSVSAVVYQSWLASTSLRSPWSLITDLNTTKMMNLSNRGDIHWSKYDDSNIQL